MYVWIFININCLYGLFVVTIKFPPPFLIVNKPWPIIYNICNWKWGLVSYIRRVGMHVWENRSVAWKWSFLVIFTHFLPGVRQRPKWNFPKACSLWWQFKPNIVYNSCNWKVRGPQGITHEKKWGFFAVFCFRLS